MITFRVYFKDGNQKLFEAKNLYELISYICFETRASALDIYKIEEVGR